jgi:3-isopropylmalate dehydrogenase
MMLRHSLGLEDEAAAVETAVDTVLESGARTADLGGPVTTTELGRKIIQEIG